MKHAFFAILFLLCTAASSGLNASGLSDEELEKIGRDLNEAMKESLTKELSTYSNSTDSSVLRDAFGFILNGDDGWSGSIQNSDEYYTDSDGLWDPGQLIGYDIKNCIIEYGYKTEYRDWVPLRRRTVNLNKFNWKTFQKVYITHLDLNIFKVKCVGYCNAVTEATSGKAIKDWKYFGVAPRVKYSRFKAAMRDIAEECPGVQTKY